MSRVEEDLIGTKEIADQNFYGVHTARAIENFQISGKKIQDVPEFVRAMVQVKKACALANMACHALPTKIGEAIVKACDLILDEGRCMDQFPIDVFLSLIHI